jgi:ATP-dependent DNA helicase RecG
MFLQLGILLKRQDWQTVEGVALPIDDEWIHAFFQTLPYTLTAAQQKAIQAIRQDLEISIPMNRLLQGDVGSGKTVIAALALGIAVANGKQAAFMAPTSILAEQHYQNLQKLLPQHPALSHIQIRLLTGATSETERKEIYEGLSNNSIHIVIGTHALIQERVEFADLALAVIDEQHRFGVEERGALRGKGINPHILVMTATPIPRTLALTMYADLDLTTLDEMPPGRTPIETRIVFEEERERVYRFIERHIHQGRQVYIIYPLVAASESLDFPAAIEAYEDLKKTTFRNYRLGLLHGRMKPSEKDAMMAEFSAGNLDILVSTSVIEVGIDVPNATVILIEGASRFGLAQLHQLRGRVGRGQHPSHCILMSNNDDAEALERLKIVEGSNDGFVLAQKDWEIRGPGDLLGTRQAGFITPVRLDNIMNVQLVELAQTESRTLFEEDPHLEHAEHTLLAEQLRLLQNRQTDFS